MGGHIISEGRVMRIRPALVGLAATLVLAACAEGAADAPVADGETEQVLTETSVHTVEEAVETLVDDGVQRSATYRGTVFTIRDVRTSVEPPQGDAVEDLTYVYVTVEVENTLHGTTMRYPTGLFLLKTGDREVSRSDGFLGLELLREIRIEPDEVLIGDLVFALEAEFEWMELALTVDESGRESAIIPLAGPMPPPPHPVQVGISGGRESVTSSSVDRKDVDVEPLGVEVGLDWGSTRSELGFYFLVPSFRAYGLSQAGGGTNVFGTMFRLEVDGVPRGPWKTEGSCGLINVGEAADCLPIFQVPHNAERLELIVGETGEKQARYGIDLSG